jgi:glucokinase
LHAVGVDIGGTKLLAGVVGPDGAVLARRRLRTPPEGGAAVAAAVVGVVRELWEAARTGPLPVGVGAAGLIDLDGTVRYSPNIPGWKDTPLRAELAEALGVDVRVDNDANTAAWAESRLGAGRDAGDSLLMLTVGTGVGGGLIHAGELVRGRQGLAAEFGHVIVHEGGPRCGCGNHGCLEAMASGQAIARGVRDGLARGERSVLEEVAEPSGKDVTRAAEDGDAFATAVLAECGFWLGVGIASLVNALDPAVVVVGGGAMQAGELLLGPARTAYSARVLGAAHRKIPLVAPAALGDDAGMVGAALLASC